MPKRQRPDSYVEKRKQVSARAAQEKKERELRDAAEESTAAIGVDELREQVDAFMAARESKIRKTE